MVPGGTNNHNYANVDLILDLAKRIPVQVIDSERGGGGKHDMNLVGFMLFHLFPLTTLVTFLQTFAEYFEAFQSMYILVQIVE